MLAISRKSLEKYPIVHLAKMLSIYICICLDGSFMNGIVFTSISQVLPHLCRWTFNPAVLTKVHGSISSSHTSSPSGAGAVGGLHAAGGEGDNSSNSFAIGDMVQILNDVERVKQLQRGKYL